MIESSLRAFLILSDHDSLKENACSVVEIMIPAKGITDSMQSLSKYQWNICRTRTNNFQMCMETQKT